MAALDKDNKEELTGKTALDDNNAIYQRERKKPVFSELSRKEKLWYICEYYKLPIITGIVILILIPTLIVPWITKVDPELSITSFNQTNPDKDSTYMEELAAKALDLDRKYIAYSEYTKGGDNATMEYATASAVVARFSAGEFDVILSDKKTAQEYCKTQSVACDLEKLLPADMISYLKDKFIHMEDSDGNSKAYGLDLAGTKLITEGGYVYDQPTLWVAVNSSNTESDIAYIRAIYGLDK